MESVNKKVKGQVRVRRRIQVWQVDAMVRCKIRDQVKYVVSHQVNWEVLDRVSRQVKYEIS